MKIKLLVVHDPIINTSVILKKKKDLSIDSKKLNKRLFFKHWKIDKTKKS